jgi:IS30 family transposase
LIATINKIIDPLSNAIINRLKPLSKKIRTLTYANGKVSAKHATVDKALGSISYYADPFSGWPHGSNENLNGFIRQ